MYPLKNTNVRMRSFFARTVNPVNGRFARRLAVTLVIGASASYLSAAFASAAPLINAQWSVSNNASNATGVHYTYQLTTATTGTIASITMTVPPGTAGTPTIVSHSVIGAGTVGLAANTLTYTVSSPVSVSSGTPILIEFGGIDNTATLGSSTSTVTTLSTSTVTPLESGQVTIDSGTTNTNTITGASSPPVTASANTVVTTGPQLAHTGAASTAPLGALGAAMVTAGMMLAITGRNRLRRRRLC